MTAPAFRSIGLLLDAHRRRDPDRVALVEVDGGGRITFAELAAAVDDAAVRLARAGVARGSRVVLLPNTDIETVVRWLAIWRAGGVVCPLDLAFLRSAGPAVLATLDPRLILSNGQGDADHALETMSDRVLRVEGRWTDRSTANRGHDWHDEIARLPHHAFDDVAGIACTSGTTGRPRLVVYDHRSYWQNGLDSIALLDLGAHDRTLEYRSFGWYSAQILSLMPFLQTGLCLHLARRFSSQRFADWIDGHAITVCVGVPSVINRLVHAGADLVPGRLRSLRAMTSSTAPLATSLWFRFEERYGVRLFNLYGSSEGGWICGNRPHARRIGTVGRAVPGVTLTVVDGERVVPDGTPGQVQVRTDKLALGYLRDDGTLDALRGTPLLLRDLAVRDGDGYVRVLGRSDDLINRGGIKMAPAEIEEVLATHVAIVEAAVVGVPDAVHGQVPVAFVVARPGRSITTAEAIAHCAAYLAREKVPVDVVVVDALPSSPRGKLLRSRLLADYEALRP